MGFNPFKSVAKVVSKAVGAVGKVASKALGVVGLGTNLITDATAGVLGVVGLSVDKKKTQTVGSSAAITQDVLQAYVSKYGRYPSNTQVWTLGKDAEDKFNPELLSKMDFGTTLAPRGRTIFSPFEQIRPGVATSKEKSRPSAVAFFAGRVFYGGIDAENPETNLTTGHVFFSQIVSDISRVGMCFQSADPTSEHISDLIDDDGGVIPISGCGRILALVPLLGSLVVIAKNGIWEITGVEGPFTATNYMLNQISEFGGLTEDYVRYENTVFFISETDIMMVHPSEEGGTMISESLSAGVINNFYRKIPAHSKNNAVLGFDPSEKNLMMLYSDEPDKPSRRTQLLNYNFNLQAWFRYSFSMPDEYSIESVTYITEALSKDINDTIYVGDQEVVVGWEPVDVRIRLKINSTPQMRFMIKGPGFYRFAYLRDDSFHDFDSFNYDSYVVTGVNTFQDTMRNKQIEYLIPSLKRTEKLIDGEVKHESSCMLSTRWDFSDSNKSNKWSRPQQVYRFNRFFIPDTDEDFGYGHDVIQTKNRVRGTGKALNFVFEAEPGKDLHLYGWAVSMSGRSRV